MDVGRDIGEVQVAPALGEGDGPGVLDHGELVVVDGEGECLGFFDF